MTSPMTQLRRAHELSHWRKPKEDTAAAADDETAHVAEDVGLFVSE